MTITDIKEYLKNNSENQEVINFLDSVSDKRVNQAIDKIMKNKVPELVEAETNKRLELVKERDQAIESEKIFNKEVEEKLKELNIPKKLGLSMLSGVDSSISDEELNQKFEEIKSVKEELFKAKYDTGTPRASDPIEVMTTEQQVLKNILQ